MYNYGVIQILCMHVLDGLAKGIKCTSNGQWFSEVGYLVAEKQSPKVASDTNRLDTFMEWKRGYPLQE